MPTNKSDMEPLLRLRTSQTFPISTAHTPQNSAVPYSAGPVATAGEVWSQKGFVTDKFSRPTKPPGSSTEYQKKKKFPRISKPVELIKRDYDVVVIGSGYGGGVAASRMARGGQSVCLLELGRERWRKCITHFMMEIESLAKDK